MADNILSDEEVDNTVATKTVGRNTSRNVDACRNIEVISEPTYGGNSSKASGQKQFH